MQGQSDRVGISGEIQLHFNCRSNVSCGVKLNEWGSGQDVEQRRPDHPAHTPRVSCWNVVDSTLMVRL